MNISWIASGIDPKNEPIGYVFSYCCFSALELLSQNVKVFHWKEMFSKNFTKFETLLLQDDPDLIVVQDVLYTNPVFLERLKKEHSIPLFAIMHGDPVNFGENVKHSRIYDNIFTNALKCVDTYREYGISNVEWLPDACNHVIFRPLNIEPDKVKTYEADVSFIGTLYRPRIKKVTKYLLPLTKHFEVKIYGDRRWYIYKFLYPSLLRIPVKCIKGFVHYEKMPNVINASKINLYFGHPSLMKGGSPSMRPFEVLGCRKFFLGEKFFGVERLFKVGKEIAVFEEEIEAKEFVELVQYFLNNEEEQEKIATNGYKRVMNEHTWVHRMKQLLSRVK